MKNDLKNAKIIVNPAFSGLDTSKIFVEKRKKAQETLEQIGLPNFEKISQELKEKGFAEA